MSKKHFPNFDWIRLFLSIEVVAIHADAAHTVFLSPVPAFLSISGFLVLGSMERRPVSQFFISRALRVLPMLFISFILIGLLFGINNMIHNIKFWLWPFGELPISPVVWSLFYEELYYALLGVLFVAGVYRLKILPLLLFILLLAGTTIKIYDRYGLPSPLFMLGAAFFLGNTIYILRSTILKINKWVALACFIALGTIMYNQSYDSIVRPEIAYLDCLTFIAMIAFAIAGPQLPKLNVDLSYSLYVLHYIVRAVLLKYMPLGVAFFWVNLLCTLPLCFLAWRFIEAPALRIKSKLAPSKGEPILITGEVQT
jgi:peptidoglycan/LPS O-acetylase OafA/YrhL